MGKIKWGMMMVDGRGKVGGTVMSRNRSGAYIRNKVTPVNPRSIAQMKARTRLGQLSAQWNDLTEGQRQAWMAMAPNYATTDVFGDLKNPTGKNLFVRLNTNLDLVGLPSILNPVLPESLPPFDIVNFEAVGAPGGNAMSVTFAGTADAPSNLIIEATPVQPVGKYFVESEYRVLPILEGTNIGPELSFGPEYVERFGSPEVGGKVFVRVSQVNANSGQRSVVQERFAIVQA